MTRLIASKESLNMDRASVRSRNIRSVGYDPATRTLEVEFHSGGLYQYSGVPETIYQGFMRAASKGSYFHDHIKDRYPCRQVR
jgi:hypothetical protein